LKNDTNFYFVLIKPGLLKLYPGSSTLEVMYNKMSSFTPWNVMVPYSPGFAVLFIVGYFFTAMAKIYGAALVIFFSEALSFQFKKLIENAANTKITFVYFADLQNKGRIIVIFNTNG